MTRGEAFIGLFEALREMLAALVKGVYRFFTGPNVTENVIRFLVGGSDDSR